MSRCLPVILSGWSSQDLANEIAVAMGAPLGKVAYRQFPDHEIQTTIEENISARDAIVVASAAGDPNKQEKETRLLLRAADRSNAKSVTLLLPYMWYGRSDDSWDERNAPALIDTIETLREHCNKAIIIDPHNHILTREKFVDSTTRTVCKTLHLGYPFAIQLRHLFNQGVLDHERLMFAHADAGGSKRIGRSFRNAAYNVLEIKNRNPEHDDWAQGIKDRDKVTGKSKVTGFSQNPAGKDVVIFEDMVSSAGTMCDLAQYLKDRGARSVIFLASHGLFTPKEDQTISASVGNINNSAIDILYVSDTYNHRLIDPEIHHAIEKSPVIHVIKTASYLGAILTALNAEYSEDDLNSISALQRGTHPDLLSSNLSGDQKPVVSPVSLKADCPLLKL